MKIENKFNFFHYFFLIFLNFIACHIAYAEDNQPALNMLKQVSSSMIQDLKTHAEQIKNDPKYVYQLAYKHIVPKASIDEMSRRVLPPDVWRSMSAQQKILFKKQFTLLLIRTYGSALNSYRNQTIQFLPIRSGGEQNRIVQIDSEIIEPGNQPISVSYKLQNIQGWKLVDLTVEGVSLVNSFRSQFSSMLNRNDVNALINDMEKHNAN